MKKLNKTGPSTDPWGNVTETLRFWVKTLWGRTVREFLLRMYESASNS